MLYISTHLIGCRIQKTGHKPLSDEPFVTYDSPKDLGVLIGFSKKEEHKMLHILIVLTVEGQIKHYKADSDGFRIHKEDLSAVMNKLRRNLVGLNKDVEEVHRSELIDLEES